MDTLTLKRKALELKKDFITMIYEAGTGHTGSDLSCTDILVSLYYHQLNIEPSCPDDPKRDRYIQSKGHAVEILWAILADKGFFDKSELKTFSQFGSRLLGHPNNKVEGIEMNTGSLGHGLALAVGSALAAKLDGKYYHTYTLLGDGELAEGSVWEAAMAGANFQLDNLTAIIDRNRLQITGSTEDVMRLDNLHEKWHAFGWHVVNVQDGNDIEQLIKAYQDREPGKPTVIIANTVKGKGLSDAEGVASWHHHVFNEEEFTKAMRELDIALEALNNEG
ncbi:transketolase [Tuanshanicoccus lijuaniae]|uniref:transketolase n=1 Tax=Aerococcaceae bacterium zg-1292 TaxID=2774330 RepID=UPI001BD8358B|nr:transketolase [Aerococcaceae bacterium zg-A91]MBS4457505.1 transketolase [Aerococcaceae bacterium zg-BR33]